MLDIDRIGLGWVGLDWIKLDWVGLGWVGLGWVGRGLGEDQIYVNMQIYLNILKCCVLFRPWSSTSNTNWTFRIILSRIRKIGLIIKNT